MFNYLWAGALSHYSFFPTDLFLYVNLLIYSPREIASFFLRALLVSTPGCKPFVNLLNILRTLFTILLSLKQKKSVS